MDPNTCLIFGELPGAPDMAERLNRAVRLLAAGQGVRHFIAGPGDEFDWYAAQAVVRLRPLYPDLTLTRLHPPAGQGVGPLPSWFDDELFPATPPQKGRQRDLVKAERSVLPQLRYMILYAPFALGWAYRLTEGARRLAARGRLQLWDIAGQNFPSAQ